MEIFLTVVAADESDAGRAPNACWTGIQEFAKMARSVAEAVPCAQPRKDPVNSQVESRASVPAARPRGLFGLLRHVYDWTLHWADTRWGPAALGVLAFTESSFFPVPPDPLLMALALGKPKRSLHFAALCTAASVAGGVFGYFIGLYLWQSVDQFFFQYVPGFTADRFEFVRVKYEQNAFLAIFAAAFTPIPYKVFTVASGVFQAGLPVLISASVLGRGMRFFLVAALLGWIGEPAKHFIDRYFNLLTIAFFVLLALGFWVVKYFL
jgi:membrane protein YqaA with SNARE-associated domain